MTYFWTHCSNNLDILGINLLWKTLNVILSRAKVQNSYSLWLFAKTQSMALGNKEINKPPDSHISKTYSQLWVVVFLKTFVKLWQILASVTTVPHCQMLPYGKYLQHRLRRRPFWRRGLALSRCGGTRRVVASLMSRGRKWGTWNPDTRAMEQTVASHRAVCARPSVKLTT